MLNLTKILSVFLIFTLITGILNIKFPSVSAESQAPTFIETKNILQNGDFSVYDDSLSAETSNRFVGFTISGKGSYALNHEQVTVNLNGKETVAAKLTYTTQSANDKQFATFSTKDMPEFTRNKTYRFSAWIKLDYSDVYDAENDCWVEGTAFNNTGSVSLSVGKNNCNKEDYIHSKSVKTMNGWQKLSMIVDSEWLNSAWKNYNFKVGISVYIMKCNIYIADMRFEEYVGNVVCEDDENIIENGDFEDYNKAANKFYGWSTYLHNSGRTLSLADGISGNAMLLTSSDSSTIINTSKEVTLDNARSYKISVWVKTAETEQIPWGINNYSNGVYLEVSYGDTVLESEHIYAVNDWKKLSVDVTDIPEEQQSLKIKVIMDYTRGLLYIDDASVTPILGGSVLSDALNANAGQTVNFTVTPENGYAVIENSVEVKFTDSDGNVNILPLEGVGNSYSFTMPEKADVYVTSCMKALPESGDVNADSGIDVRDLIRFKKHIGGTKVLYSAEACELDDISGLSGTDLAVLRKMLLTDRSKESLDFEGFEFWTENPLERIRKADKNNRNKTYSLVGAKGEYESFQIAVGNSSDSKLVINDIIFSDFSDKNGNKISAHNVTVYREHYVIVEKSSPKTGKQLITEKTGEIPDALIPVLNPETGEKLSGARFTALPYSIPKRTVQPFFIDVLIPRDAIAGDYTATVSLVSENLTRTFEVNLKVWDITLSKVQTQGSYFNLFAPKYYKAMAVEAAKNRIFINGTDYDTQKMLYENYGYNNANLAFWSGADLSNPNMKAPPTASAVSEKKAKFYEKLNLFSYTADEIGGKTDLYDDIVEYAKSLHQGGVKQLITMSPVPELLADDGLGTGRSAVDIWVMLPKQFENATDNITLAREKGCEIWTYNCLVQDSYSPKWLLDYKLINYRIHPGFINYYNDVDGFMFWSVANYNKLVDPWKRLNDNLSGEVWNGDGILFYPSEDIGIENSFVPSLRVKAIRDGFEDYELCSALEEQGINSKLYVKEIATDFYNWTQDSEVLMSNRKILGDSIS